ncbi:MAG: HPr family phosphocarrier protein [Lachnospiraceae bacterium]|nr:HPr family phosphocarrier protein [Lachnospiraceae bacterium]
MTTRRMEIQLPTGLEARPVAMLVQVASQYHSKIYIEAEDKKINAKSIMGMMGLGLVSGEEIAVSADGEDEEQALDGIQEYLSNQK